MNEKSDNNYFLYLFEVVTILNVFTIKSNYVNRSIRFRLRGSLFDFISFYFMGASHYNSDIFC